MLVVLTQPKRKRKTTESGTRKRATISENDESDAEMYGGDEQGMFSY